MKIQIEIPEEFEEHFGRDRFEDSLHRLSADAHLIDGRYEQETAVMLIKALKNAEFVNGRRQRRTSRGLLEGGTGGEDSKECSSKRSQKTGRIKGGTYTMKFNIYKNGVQDLLGDWYPSFTAMCKKHRVHPSTVKRRLERGESLERALDATRNRVIAADSVRKKPICRDHIGKEYATEKEMAQAYGIEISLFVHRIQRGWGLEEALTISADGKGRKRKRNAKV